MIKLKKVINGIELKDKLIEAINILCDNVKITLGPKGNNVIIDHSTLSPFITNDGVTIASNIESEDPIINTILEIAKEASIKTNEKVGDGTTTTLVLLQSILKNGIKALSKTNSIILKKEIDIATENVIKKLKILSQNPTKKQLTNIANISANDKEIGQNIANCYLKYTNKNAISIKEGETQETIINNLKGYSISTNIASPYFFKEGKSLKILNPYLLLIDNILYDLSYLENIINYFIETNESLIIIAKDYNEELINQITSLYLDNTANIILLKNPEYGLKEQILIDDLRLISNSNNIELNILKLNHLGKVKEVNINKEFTNFSFDNNEKIKKRIYSLKKTLYHNQFDYDYNSQRIAMLENGLIEILVGAPTKTERREKKMRYDDALWAIDSAAKGVIPGGGITLLRISNEINPQTIGEHIIKKSLQIPFEQIINNAGLDLKKIKNKIIKNNFELLYNINTDNYEALQNTEVLDSTLVLINAITSASSIATMLLTTNCLIINEHQNNLNKQIDYLNI